MSERTIVVHPPATAHPILWASQCIPVGLQKSVCSTATVFSETEQGISITLLFPPTVGRRMLG